MPKIDRLSLNIENVVNVEAHVPILIVPENIFDIVILAVKSAVPNGCAIVAILRMNISVGGNRGMDSSVGILMSVKV